MRLCKIKILCQKQLVFFAHCPRGPTMILYVRFEP
jgi:hypothetical protein